MGTLIALIISALVITVAWYALKVGMYLWFASPKRRPDEDEHAKHPGAQ
jgi:hypothetical protein